MLPRGPVGRAALAVLLLIAAGCGRDEPDRVAAPPGAGPIAGLPGQAHIVPGPAIVTASAENPYAGDRRAIDDGERLYGWYNCGACHGALGGGGMGPPLRDPDWIYGGDAVSIFESIMEGRPEGMPTWQGKIPDDQAWRIVAYVQSLGEIERQPALTPPEDRVPSGGGGSGRPPGGP